VARDEKVIQRRRLPVQKKEKVNVLTGGLILITLGVLIILGNAHIIAFGKSWPILLIVIAICILIQRLRDFGGWILMAVGVVFLVLEGGEVRIEAMWKYFMPVVIIIVGASLLMRRRRK
jgi:hypothetical protein